MANLVAQGLTNREIAARLFISERTAESHVEQIRGKLGYRSRSQIAAWVANQAQAVDAPATSPASSGRAADAGPAQGRPAQTSSRPTRRFVLLGSFGLLVALLLAGFVLATSGLVTTRSTSPQIATVAGTGLRAFSRDGGLADASALVRPVAVAVGPGGKIYIAEGNRVREVEPDGRISTLAGTGDAGDAGDGGPAAQAQLNTPQGLAVDSLGRVYIADTLSNRIRRVDSDGTIRTVAGTGEAGYAGDGTPAIDAKLNLPTGLAIGFGDELFVADTGNNVIRELASDGVIRTFAGTGEAGYRGDGGPAQYGVFHSPGGLAFDDEGDLYIADTLNQRIRRVDVNGEISTVAGSGIAAFGGDGGPAIYAELDLASNPLEGMGQAIAAGPRGDIFIADGLNHRLRRVDVNGVISTVALMKTPLGMAVDPHGVVYVADADDNRVLRIA